MKFKQQITDIWPPHVNKRECLIIFPVYFFLSFINLRAKLAVTPAWTRILPSNHEKLLAFDYTNNEQSRLLQWYIPELMHKFFGMDIRDAYAMQRLLFVFLAFVVMHAYLRKWFSKAESLCGVLILAAVMPLTYLNHLQESAPLLLFSFGLAMIFIRDHKDLLLCLTLAIGVANNETILSLMVVYFFCNISGISWKDLWPVCAKTIVVTIPAWAILIFIRYTFKDNPHLGEPFQLPQNVEMIWYQLLNSGLRFYYATYLFPFFLFNFLWIYSFLNFRDKPFFLRRAAWLFPFFIVPHFITGIIEESRQMVPLAYLVIPMSLYFILDKNKNDRGRTRIND
jgi:hypothetical protein